MRYYLLLGKLTRMLFERLSDIDPKIMAEQFGSMQYNLVKSRSKTVFINYYTKATKLKKIDDSEWNSILNEFSSINIQELNHSEKTLYFYQGFFS